MATYHVIGQSIPRVDGAAKATGQALYAADVSLPGTLWGKSLHSPYAHARIVRIDTTAAQQVPGVHAVITGADVRAGLWGRAVKMSAGALVLQRLPLRLRNRTRSKRCPA